MTHQLDISAMIFDEANGDVGNKVKRLSGNKVRITMTDAQAHALAAEAKRFLAEGNANQRRAAKGVADAVGKLPLAAAKKPAKARKAKKAKPAPAGAPKALYDALYTAFDHFNAQLFDGKLPPVMIVAQRKRNTHGYFWNGMWKDGNGGEMSEIALNPETLGRGPKEVLSTLVHEMVHHEQQLFGKPSKSGHNVEWCEMMERVDLTPVGVGNCAGKRSGRNFTHEIVEGGKFDVACDAILKKIGEDMKWHGKVARTVKTQDKSKVKHTCQNCGTNIWGKEGIMVNCCDELMRPAYYA